MRWWNSKTSMSAAGNPGTPNSSTHVVGGVSVPVKTGGGVGGTAGSAVDCPSNLVKRGELLDSIRNDQLVVVTGTGVSLHSVGFPAPGTAIAGWPGLLQHGLDHCLGLQLLNADEAAIVGLQIKNGTTDYLIEAAQKIHDCLDKRDNARYWWMKESVGQLKLTEPGLIRAIQSLGGLLATLNYDSLMQEVTGRPPVHWRQQSEITRYLRNHSKDFILHLHGQWDVPNSIVLDRRSYEAIAGDVKMQDLLRRFARFETIVFVGCGQTFFDPNFKTLLKWARQALQGAEHRHFILCRQSEEPGILTALQPHGYLAPLVYGEKYSDLTPFLEALGDESGASAAAANPPVATKPVAGVGSVPKLLKPVDVWKLQSHR